MCRDLLFGLGLAVSPEEEDLYLRSREALLAETTQQASSEEAAVAEEELALSVEGKSANNDHDVSDSDSELSENVSDDDNDNGVTEQQQPIKQKRKPSVVDQV